MTRLAWIALAMLALLSVSFVFDHGLWTPDEPRDAEIARETGFSALPTLNQRPFLEKPPLFYWSVAASYEAFGVSAWSARLPSVLFAWGTWLFTYLLARRVFGIRAAVHATLILATTLMFFHIMHKSTVDSALVFLNAGVSFWLYSAYRAQRQKALYYGVAYVFALGAFLTKGAVGLALAPLAFLAFLIWQKEYRELLRARPWLALVVIGVGGAPWLLSLAPDLRHTWFVDNHLGRLTGKFSAAGHQQPFYYYAIAWTYVTAPWTLALVPALAWIARPLRSTVDDADRRFLLSWLIVGVGVLSLAATKRGVYLLPLLPAAAILVAAWFDRVSARPEWATALLYGFAGLLGAAQVCVWVLAASLGDWPGLAVAVAIATGAALGAIVARECSWPLGLSLATTSILVGGLWVAVPPLEAIKNLEPFIRKLPEKGPIPALNPDETTLALIPFHARLWVEPVTAPGQKHLVVTLKRANEELPQGYRVLAKHEPRPVRLFGHLVPVDARRMYLLEREPQ